MPPSHKCRIRNTENLINAAAFNQINTVQSTLSKTDTFRTGTKTVSVLERCLSYRESNKESKERQGPTLGVCFTEVSVL